MFINFPDPKQAGLTLGTQVVVAAMSQLFASTPLDPNGTGGKDFGIAGNAPSGVPTLTSIAFEYNNVRINLAECIITVNQEKNIVATPMQGRDGTIKEYISDGDFAITIDAAVTSYRESDPENSKAYPISQLQDLIEILKIKDGLQLQSDFLFLFGITNAVIKTYGMVQETHSNRQSFQLQLLSDTPYEIKINQDSPLNPRRGN